MTRTRTTGRGEDPGIIGLTAALGLAVTQGEERPKEAKGLSTLPNRSQVPTQLVAAWVMSCGALAHHRVEVHATISSLATAGVEAHAGIYTLPNKGA